MNRNIYILLLLTAIFSSCSKDEFVSNDDDTSRNTTSRIAFSVPDSVYIFNDSELATRGFARIKQNNDNLTIFEENDEFSLIKCTPGSKKMNCKIGAKDYEVDGISTTTQKLETHEFNSYYYRVYNMFDNNQRSFHLIFNRYSLPDGENLEERTNYVAVYPYQAGSDESDKISLDWHKEQTCVANKPDAYYCNNYDYDIFVARGTSGPTIKAFRNEEGNESIIDFVPLELAFIQLTTKYITTLSGIPSGESVDYVEYEFTKGINNYYLHWNGYRVLKNTYGMEGTTTTYKVNLKSSEGASGVMPISSGDFYNETQLKVAVTFVPMGYYFEDNPVKIKAHTTSGNFYEGLLGKPYEGYWEGKPEYYGHNPSYQIKNYVKEGGCDNIYHASKVMLKQTNN